VQGEPRRQEEVADEEDRSRGRGGRGMSELLPSIKSRNAFRPYLVQCPVCGAPPTKMCRDVPKNSVHVGRNAAPGTEAQAARDGDFSVTVAVLVICLGAVSLIVGVLVAVAQNSDSGYDDPSYGWAVGLSSLGGFLIIVGLLIGIWMYAAEIYRQGR
jgi:hypothetical protein